MTLLGHGGLAIAPWHARRARLEQREEQWERTEQGPIQAPARTAVQHSESSGDQHGAHRWTPGSEARSMEAPETGDAARAAANGTRTERGSKEEW